MKRRDLLKALGFASVTPSLVRSMIVDVDDVYQEFYQPDELIEKTLNGYAFLNLYHNKELFATGQDAKIIFNHTVFDGDAFYPHPRAETIQFNDLSSLDKVFSIFMSGDLISFKIVQYEHFLMGEGYLTNFEITSNGDYNKSIISGDIQVYGPLDKEVIS